jgi:thiol-disulfide isomerase/thioredoxin
MVRHIVKINAENKNVNEHLEVFNQNREKGSWFVKYYANWCPHCTSMQSQWDNLENHETLIKKNINIAEIEESFVHKLNYKPDVLGFPTIKLYNNGEGEDFQGERSTEGMANFISKKQLGGKRKKTVKTLRENKRTKHFSKKNTKRNKKNTKRNKKNTKRNLKKKSNK